MTSGMIMSSVTASPQNAQLIPVFLGQRSRNITFVVDTSEATSPVLGSVKRLLIQTLLTKASLRDSFFNIIAFSYKVSCWSDCMIPCAPDTVYGALPWIHSLRSSPGKDLLTALSMAFADPACQAVHLVSGGLPDFPEAVLQALPNVAGGRPVNVFYHADSSVPLDSRTQDFLQCLWHATGGSCYVFTVGMEGMLEKVIPLHAAEGQTSVSMPSAEKCSLATPLTSILHVPFHSLRCSMKNPFCPIPSCLLSGRVQSGSDFSGRCRVLARREQNGLYYLGTVAQEVQGRRGVWVVEFDNPECAGWGNCSARMSQQQLVCSPDMVNHTEAHKHCLVPGDTVLSPWERDLRRYGPGRVLCGMESRDSLKVECGQGLQVLMWNGCVTHVPRDLAVWIPASHHERIIRELQRVNPVPSCCDDRFCSRTSTCATQRCYSQCCQSKWIPCYCPTIHQWSPVAPVTCPCGLGDTGMERVALEKRVDLQLDELKDTKSSEPEDRSSSPVGGSPRTQGPVTSKELSPSGLLAPEQARPTWRYWRRSPLEPQHRQPGKAVASYPSPQISALPNRSSFFQPVPEMEGRRVTVADVFGQTNPKPQKSAVLQSTSGKAEAAIYN